MFCNMHSSKLRSKSRPVNLFKKAFVGVWPAKCTVPLISPTVLRPASISRWVDFPAMSTIDMFNSEDFGKDKSLNWKADYQAFKNFSLSRQLHLH